MLARVPMPRDVFLSFSFSVPSHPQKNVLVVGAANCSALFLERRTVRWLVSMTSLPRESLRNFSKALSPGRSRGTVLLDSHVICSVRSLTVASTSGCLVQQGIRLPTG